MSGSSGNNDAGLMSNAGLVRYFEEDDGYTIDPRTFAAAVALIGVLLVFLNVIF